MTIKIERDALLCVLSDHTHPSSRSLLNPLSPKEVEIKSSLLSGSCNDAFVLPLQYSYGDVDCESLYDDCTVTTASSSIVSFEPEDKRVSFAECLVTEERTRERTPREEISSLFYSCEETRRFRQEYRLERKLLAELESNLETQPCGTEDIGSILPQSSITSRHRISRVVVVHNDKLETFFNHQQKPSSPSPPVKLNVHKEIDISNDFFDIDSFWSGSVTWY